MQDITSQAQTSQTGQSFGSFRYRTYVLLTLTLLYILNFVDRILISVIGRPIIDEFDLSNFQFGILTGIGFALFYTALGIPLARLSEHYSRVRIIAICVILWSAATILCGFTIGFLTLLLARVAVGIGEAGCTPPANSLIGDYYKPEARPGALGVYALGIVLGSVIAQLAGGSVLNFFTWREAFVYVGAPGILLGVLVLLTVKEPPRGFSDPPNTIRTMTPGLREALAEVAQKRTFWLVALGTSMAAFAGYGLISFKSLYIQYTFGISPGDAAIKYMAPFSLAGAFGTTLAGFITQHFAKKSKMANIWVPAIAFMIAAPLLVLGFNAKTLPLMFTIFMVAGLAQYVFIGASFNITQSIVSLRVRATAIAILLFIMNLIGYGGGPPFVGFVADHFTGQHIAALNLTDVLATNCSLSDASLSAALLDTCREAKAAGMKLGLIVGSLFFLLAGILFCLASRTYIKDLE